MMEVLLWGVVALGVMAYIVRLVNECKPDGDIIESMDFQHYMRAVWQAVEDQSEIDDYWCGHPIDMEITGYYRGGLQPDEAANAWRNDKKRFDRAFAD